jgi:hypothetical protein
VGVQAIVFGLCHATPQYGMRNVSVVLGTMIFGLVAGWMAIHYGRLGPGMWTHAWFNLAAVALLAAA